MKKASKILTLILVVVIAASLFAGCAAFGKDSVKYRNSVAVKVGGENITVGKVLDTFNSYYNSYSAYISAGYLTADSLMNMVMSSLYYQMEKVDAYKNTQGVQTTESLKDRCHNAEYLTQDEMKFVMTYVKYMVYSTVDSLVEDYIEDDFKLKAAETDDTSRDFTELDEIKEGESYAEFVYRKNFINEEMDEYIKDYYTGLIGTEDFKVDSYVYQTEAAASKMLSDYNKRIEEGDKLTFDQLKSYQEKALAQYKRNVVANYNFELEQLIKNQVEDVVTSVIVAKYNLSINQIIEGDNLDSTLDVLKANIKVLVDSDTAKFNTDGDFISFIEGLKDGDYIHSVPQEYTYIFVKNILVPFSENQKAVLANAAKILGTTDSEEYKQIRKEMATEIVADDFLSEKDKDDKYAKVENVFIMDGENLVINPACKAFSDYLSGGVVTAMDGKTKDETVIELMKQFNTDTAQHTAAYDYVVRVGKTPSSYSPKWVPEFVDGANEVWAEGSGKKNYALAVSEYGVHIIYYADDVAAQQFDFDDKAKLTDPSTNEYKLFKSYFDAQSSLILGDKQTELHKSYVDAGKITKTNNFDVFLSDNGITFDFAKSLSDED